MNHHSQSSTIVSSLFYSKKPGVNSSTMDSETEWIIFFICTSCIYLIIIPFVIYCNYSFNLHKQDIIIQKRYPSLTLLFGVLMTLNIFLSRPLYLLTYTICNDPQAFSTNCDIENKSIINFIHYFLLLCIYSFSTPNLWIVLLRYWLIYYNVNWTRSTINKTWKIHLNPSDVESDWYLSNKSKYGNIKYCGKRVFILYLIFAPCTILLKCFVYQDDGFEMNAIVGLLYKFIPMLIMMIFAFKIRKFKDGFHIIKEVKLVVLVVMSGMILFPLIGALTSILGLNLFWRSVFSTIVSAIQSTAYLYTQTLYVLRMVNNDQGLDFTAIPQKMTNDEMALSTVIEMQSEHVQRERVQSKTQRTTSIDKNGGTFSELDDTLKDGDCFEKFMQHLANEWSMELLLAFVELTQLQQAIKREFGKNDEYEMVFIPSQKAILNNDNVPQSSFDCL